MALQSHRIIKKRISLILFLILFSSEKISKFIFILLIFVGIKLRAVGGGYSFSDVYPGEGQILLDSSQLRTRQDGQPPIILEEKVKGQFLIENLCHFPNLLKCEKLWSILVTLLN